jgi:hypothetical protein
MVLKKMAMNKNAKSVMMGVFLFALTLSVLFLMGYAWAATFNAHHPVAKGGPGAIIAINDDEDSILNITINNTASNNDNITGVWIKLNASTGTINFTRDFANATSFNETNGVWRTLNNRNNRTVNFSNGNFSSLVLSNLTYIWINITAVLPGTYNISVVMDNITGQWNETVETNLTVHVNDTFTVEVNDTQGTNTEHSNITFIPVTNYTLNGNETGISMNVSIWNISRALLSNITGFNDTGSFEINWTAENLTKASIAANANLPDGIYFINVSQANSTNLDDGNISKT